MPRITSRHHPLVQRCRRLAAGREPVGTVLLDGAHLVSEALAAGVRLEAVLADDRASALADDAAAAGAAVYAAGRDVLDAASPVRSSSGIVAVAAWTPMSLADLLAAERRASTLVALAGVQDPGNVGAVIRTADALGASGVIVCEGSADPAGWKVLRGAMGSTFRVPVARASLAEALAAARAQRLSIAAAVPSGGAAIDEVTLASPSIVFFGSEGAGLPDDLVAGADLRLTVPMRPRVDSLNVAVTVALVLWEARRPCARTGVAQ